MELYITIPSFALLTYLLVEYFRQKELPSRLLRWGLFGLTTMFISRGIIYSIMQYSLWKEAQLGFLPPHTPIAYFIRYSTFHFFSGFLYSLVIAAFLLLVFFSLQRYSKGKWLDTNERVLVFLGAFAAGWPGAILYAFGVFLLPLVATPWLAKNVTQNRVRLAPFIIVSALFALALTHLILPYAPWLDILDCKTCI